jgi:hypothetical protein
MTIDERLRRGLHADLAPPASGLDVRAGRVLERARRRRVVRRATTGVVIAAVVGLAAIAAPRLLDLGRPLGPAVRPDAPPPPVPTPSRISRGTFRTTIPSGGQADALGASGRWRLTLGEHDASLGRVGDPPATGPVSWAEGSITVDALACGQGPGRYAWGVEGATLRFSLIRDPCPLRRFVLLAGEPGSHGWAVIRSRSG